MGGIALLSRRLVRATTTERAASPGAISKALAIPKLPDCGATLHAFVALSAMVLRRSRVPGAPPPGRWQCEQLVCKYARARSVRERALSAGLASAGKLAGAVLIAGENKLIVLSVVI
jgi:hypothetical protein